jgi:4-hydroxy-2-oxoheptanedioate aldolase
MTVFNFAREKLEQGQLSLGVGVRMTGGVEIDEAMAVVGFDWLFPDMEPGVTSLVACAQISTAALDAGITPIARVPNGECAIATQALDNGALGEPGAPGRLLWTEGSIDTAAMQIGAWSIVWRIAEKS